uniref:Uncharacterized protein n=1 Tax=Tanacetum cinerariifolium TaxID=118510 RepID=A0A6L2NQM8_TANCI|nr:hypothetical protein [Tanacetum cinerariifolium]
MFEKVCPIVNAPVLVGFLGAYNLRVATPRAMVHGDDKTSEDVRSAHGLISLIVCAFSWIKLCRRNQAKTFKRVILASCQNSTLCVEKYSVRDLSSCAGSELGSDLTSLAESIINGSSKIPKDPFKCFKRVEDFQLGIESYQIKVNLTKQGWNATGYEFKHDYTIIKSPRAVVFPVNNNKRKIMRFNKIYKFSDGTLTRILEALAYRVKEFKIKWLNPGMNTRFWTQKDVTRIKEFTADIERRLKTKRIYQNLECFVGRRVHDIDYRLL